MIERRVASGARALVLCAILFRPEGAAADAGAPAGPLETGRAAREKDESATSKDDPPGDAPPVDAETRRYCEERQADCESRPRTRLGCIPDARCRVWDAERRAPPAGS